MDKANEIEEPIVEVTDRTGWGPGPWDGEPDRVKWRTAVGLPALARRGSTGQWCGYVAVPPGHPAYGLESGNVEVSVHGGLTYASRCDGPVCHVPEPGESADVYWLGFDCGHYGDRRPQTDAWMRDVNADLAAAGRPPLPKLMLNRGDFEFSTYRTLAYVRAECESLAEQLAEMKTS